jgi:hypothetical protein
MSQRVHNPADKKQRITSRRTTSTKKKKCGTEEVPLALPPLSLLVPLDGHEELQGEILGYLDIAAFCVSTAVSTSWKRGLVPRQPGVSLLGFKTLASLKDFSSATFLSAKDSDLVDDSALRSMGLLLKDLVSIDLSGCQKMSSIGVNALVKGLGAQLTEFKQDSTKKNSSAGSMRVTQATVKALAKASGLISCSLTLGSKCKGGTLSPFNGKTSLETLSFFFEGFTPICLPSAPHLKVLSVKTSDWSFFNWQTLAAAEYPMLTTLIVEDDTSPNNYACNYGGLSTNIFERLLQNALC